MRKIIEYKVVVGDMGRVASSFTRDVNALIAEGWRPLGAPGTYGTTPQFFQALVLYEPDSSFEMFGFGGDDTALVDK